MEQTRVKKYKDYRMSLGKSDKLDLKDSSENEKTIPEKVVESRSSSAPKTTTSIPYEQIMKATNYSEKEDKLIAEAKKKRIANIVLICVGIAILLTLIVLSGIVIFRQGR